MSSTRQRSKENVAVFRLRFNLRNKNLVSNVFENVTLVTSTEILSYSEVNIE